MSERMKTLITFVVYELFTKNCKRCSTETFPISSSSSKGKESLDQEGYGQETQKVMLFVNRVKRCFRTNFCSKVVL